MSIEQLTLFNDVQQHTSLAARAYEKMLFRRKEFYNMFNTQEKEQNHKELVATIEGVKYVNDAFSTNPNITWFSMEEIPSRLIWVVCDEDGVVDYTALVATVKQKVVSIIAFGKCVENIKRTFSKEIDAFLVAKDCAQAVDFAHAIAQKDDTVIFSPANGRKEDIEQRGIEFTEKVLGL